MLKNNIKIAWRNIIKRKYESLINLLGLICSITFVILVGAYVWEVHQVNSELRNKEQQYILQSNYKKEGFGIPLTSIGALPKALKEEYPQLVANYYRIDGLTCIVSHGEQIFEEGTVLGDPTLLDMFGFEIFAGNSTTALTKPFTVVITEKAAQKYFGKIDVLGQTLEIKNFKGDKQPFTITGVIKENTQNSVMQLNDAMKSDIFLPIASESYFGRSIDNWQNPYIASFIELQKGVTPEQLAIPIQALVKRNTDGEFSTNYAPDLKPLKSYFLDDNKGAVRKMIATLLWIAGFVLLMAIINFINITISQNITRLKEIGIRKMMGSSRSQIISQLIAEYMTTMLIAVTISLPIYVLLSPIFEEIFMRKLPSLAALPFSFYILLFLFACIVGLLAGIYPAIKLSGNDILQSVKNKFTQGNGKQAVRRVLIFTQFAVAVIILMATIIISKQINLFINGELGYNKESVLNVQVPRDWTEQGLKKMETTRDEFQRLPQIESISLSYEIPGFIGGNNQTLFNTKSEKTVHSKIIMSDSYFAKTYQIPLLAGHFLNPNSSQNDQIPDVVINKEALLALGFTKAEEAIGRTIGFGEANVPVMISGVTADFVPNSMNDEATAIAWINISRSAQFRFLSIRLKDGSLSSSMEALEKKWKELLPDAPFEYQFTDDRIQKLYETELQLQRASQIATIASLLIVALGIIGLITLSINLRNKEVGVRKVLGASLMHLILLFSKEFYLIFILALLVTIPASYMLMNVWLQNYNNRIAIDVVTYLLPLGFLALLLGTLIVGIIYRATRFNPIEKLRDE
ncbi:ABC transporter permease [Sphingobacterium sp. JUb56]|uniref:ABC transporter permease n=1 Tax=Sphingobacterium sp. JUb56 TaxID=2587145 RepID=UPI0016152F2B|nr:ABC transporter permease [Sphingobacterium sp. JUb56]MBB2952719.1 ABC-type antimicrobial peptide transport system permease subunit [Sphingobacterium sp. JUb56]